MVISNLVLNNKVAQRILITGCVMIWLLDYFVMNSIVTISAYCLAFTIAILTIMSPNRNDLGIYVFLVVLSALAFISFLISRLYFLTPSLGIITVILNLWIAYAIAQYGAFYKFLKAIFISFSVYIFFSIAILNMPPDTILTASRNHISVIALSLLAISTLDQVKYGKINPIYPIFAFITCCMAQGRMGIIVGTFLVVCISASLIINNNKKGSSKFFIFIFAIMILGAFFLFLFQQGYFDRFIISTLNSSSRKFILQSYFDEFSIFDLIFGKDVSFARDLDPKLSIHNSYLGLHTVAGISGLILIAVIFFFNSFLLKENFILAIISLSLLLRAATDNFLFTHHFISGSSLGALIIIGYWQIMKIPKAEGKNVY